LYSHGYNVDKIVQKVQLHECGCLQTGKKLIFFLNFVSYF